MHERNNENVNSEEEGGGVGSTGMSPTLSRRQHMPSVRPHAGDPRGARHGSYDGFNQSVLTLPIKSPGPAHH